MKALVVTLLLLLGLLVVADRVGVAVAEDRVAAVIAERGQLAGAPDVDIGGFPFLTQAVGGEYEQVQIALTADDLGQPAGTRADVTLRGVQVPLPDVLTGSVAEVPVGRIDGVATLSYELLSQQLGAGTTLRPEGDGLRITRTVELAGVQVPLTATGTVVLAGDELVVQVAEASGAGVDLPDFLVERAADALDLRYRIDPLPFGLELTGVAPGEDGVDLAVAATDTVLSG